MAATGAASADNAPDELRPRPNGQVRAAVVDILLAALVFVGVVAAVPTALSAPTVVRSDAGVFYSVFHQLAQGRRLYAEVFDHKDPLFYAPHATAYALVGLPGPMVWETLVSAVLVLAVVLLGRQLGLPPLGRLAVAATFAVLHFLPDVYVPLHTYHQGIALLILALVAAAAGRPLVAGGLFGAAILSKLPLVAMLPAMLLLAAFGHASPASWWAAGQRVTRALAGVLATVAAVLAALLARGELGGYGDAILQNLAYPTLNVSVATSFRQGSNLWDRATSLLTTPLVVAYLALLGIAAAVVIVAFARRLAAAELRSAVLALAVGIGAFAMLRTASWWSHHFQVAGLAFALVVVPTMLLLRRLSRPLSLGGTLALVLGVGGLLLSPRLAGTYALQPLELRAADPCDLQERPGRRAPSRRECALLGETWPDGTRFATIQQNESGALAAWTGPEMRLACRLFYQFPWFRPELLDELADCLERGEVDVIFKAPLGYDVPRLQRRLDRVLRRDFELVRRHGDVEVWQRR